MFSGLRRYFQKVSIIERHTAEQQIAFLELMLLVVKADGRIDIHEDLSFGAYVNLVNWSFPYEEQLAESNKKTSAMLQEHGAVASFIDEVALLITDTVFRAYIIRRLSSLCMVYPEMPMGDVDMLDSLRRAFGQKPEWDLPH